MAVKVNPAGREEVIEVYLSETEHPIAYKTRLEELIKSGLSEKDAREEIATQPFQMELYYSPDCGLFAVESMALESITPYDPYTGEEMENTEEED